MKAQKVQHLSAEHLSAYLDGQVTPEERRQVESHLRTCPQCAWELESLRHTVSLLRQVRQVAVPRPLTLREIDVRPARTPQRVWLLPYLQGATALVSLLLVVLVAGDLLLGLGRAPQARPLAQPVPAVAPAPLAGTLPAERAAGEATAEVALAKVPAAPGTPATEEAPMAAALPAEEGGPQAAEGGEAAPSGEAVLGGETEATASPSPVMRALGEPTMPVVPGPPGDMGGIGGPAALPTEREPVSALAGETPTPTPTALPSPTPTPRSPTAVAMAPEVATATPEAAPLVAVATPSPVPLPAPAGEAAAAVPAPGVPWVRLAEMGLLGAALVLGGLTLLLRGR